MKSPLLFLPFGSQADLCIWQIDHISKHISHCRHIHHLMQMLNNICHAVYVYRVALGILMAASVFL